MATSDRPPADRSDRAGRGRTTSSTAPVGFVDRSAYLACTECWAMVWEDDAAAHRRAHRQGRTLTTDHDDQRGT